MISEQAVERYRAAAESVGIRLEYGDGVVLHGGMAICSEPELHGYIRGWQRSGAKCDWAPEITHPVGPVASVAIDDGRPVSGKAVYFGHGVGPNDVVAAR